MKKVKYYFKSKVNSKWVECPDEETVRRMAADGYEVKKIVYEKSQGPKFYRMGEFI